LTPSELGKTSPLVPEAFDLILALCRRPDEGPVSAQAVARLGDREFREVFHGLATKHGVLGLALTTLGQLSTATTLSPETRQRVLAPLRILKQQALLWDLERDRVLRVLAREDLPVVVLKGGALREYAFANAVERQLGDLDLLLDQTLVDRAAAVLADSGYRLPSSDVVIQGFSEHHFHLPLAHPGGFEVELHWALNSPHESFTLDSAGFMARAVTIPRPQGKLAMPSTEDMLLHLASQNTEDGFSRLRRMVDVDRIVARGAIDWTLLQQGARKSGLEVILGLTLRLSQLLLGTRVPDGLIDSLGISRIARLHLALLSPTSWLPAATGLRHHLGGLAMAMWCTTPNRQAGRLRLLWAGEAEPLAWLWKGKEQAEAPQAGLLAGPVLVVRLMAYHILIWARGATRLATPAGRRQLSFWSDKPFRP
jgi:hypothetical protein